MIYFIWAWNEVRAYLLSQALLMLRISFVSQAAHRNGFINNNTVFEEGARRNARLLLTAAAYKHRKAIRFHARDSWRRPNNASAHSCCSFSQGTGRSERTNHQKINFNPWIFPLDSVSIRLYHNVTQTFVPKFKVQILNMTLVPGCILLSINCYMMSLYVSIECMLIFMG